MLITGKKEREGGREGEDRETVGVGRENGEIKG